MTILTAKNATGFIVHRKDGSAIHAGYQGRTAKLYTAKGHATTAANKLNRWGNRKWNPVSRQYEDQPNTNPWVVSPAHLLLQEDAVRVKFREYLTTNTNVDAKAVESVLDDLMAIVVTNA